jgi:hypothetical protein
LDEFKLQVNQSSSNFFQSHLIHSIYNKNNRTRSCLERSCKEAVGSEFSRSRGWWRNYIIVRRPTKSAPPQLMVARQSKFRAQVPDLVQLCHPLSIPLYQPSVSIRLDTAGGHTSHWPSRLAHRIATTRRRRRQDTYAARNRPDQHQPVPVPLKKKSYLERMMP